MLSKDAIRYADYNLIAGHKHIVEILLDAGADPDLAHRVTGLTALMHATRQGHHQVAKLLMAKGADVNVQSRYKLSALHYAAAHGSVDTLHALKAGGADVSQVMQHGEKGELFSTAAELARHKSKHEAADLLEQWDRENWRKMDAAGTPHREMR